MDQTVEHLEPKPDEVAAKLLVYFDRMGEMIIHVATVVLHQN